MAGFKTHTSVGTITGFVLMIAVYLLGWATNFPIAVYIFIATALGSFLPDLDSDTGLPYQIIFGLYSLVAAAIAFYVAYNITAGNVLIALIAPAATFVLMRFVLAPLFKRYTKHRGMFHSIPAMLIAFFGSLLIVSFFRLPIVDKFLIALAVAIGYLSHLILDEIYSTNILTGKFKPKKSLGTATKFFSKSQASNIFVYLLLFALMYLTAPMFQRIVQTLQQN